MLLRPSRVWLALSLSTVLNQALAAWRTSWDRFVGDLSGPLIDALSSISPEGRRRLIDAGRERRESKEGAGPISP